MKLLKWIFIGISIIVVLIGLLSLVVFVIPTNRINGKYYTPTVYNTSEELTKTKYENIWIYVVPYADSLKKMYLEYYDARFNYEGVLWEIEHGIREGRHSIIQEDLQTWDKVYVRYKAFVSKLDSDESVRKERVNKDGTYSIRVPFGHYVAIAHLDSLMINFYGCQMYAFESTNFSEVNTTLIP